MTGRALALLTSGLLALGAAQAQDALVLSGTVEESYGADGFVMNFDGEEVIVATGQLTDDNPSARFSKGQEVTVYGAPTADLFTDGILDADAITVKGGDGMLRVREPVANLSMFGAGAGEATRDARTRLADRSRTRSGERRERAASRASQATTKAAQRAEGTKADAPMTRPDSAKANGRSGMSKDFAAYDRNGDRVITADEYIRATAIDGVTRSQAARMFEALAKGDRLVTKREFDKPSDRFERLSKRYQQRG